LLFLDSDNSKLTNDTLSHDKGNEVLGHFGAVMLRQTRGHDLPVKLHGEEFAVLLPRTDKAGAQLVAENIRTAFENIQEGTVSIGCVEIELTESLKTNLARADQAMYAAKNRGRNQVINYDD